MTSHRGDTKKGPWETTEALCSTEGFREEVTLSSTLRSKTTLIKGEGDVGQERHSEQQGDPDA